MLKSAFFLHASEPSFLSSFNFLSHMQRYSGVHILALHSREITSGSLGDTERVWGTKLLQMTELVQSLMSSMVP